MAKWRCRKSKKWLGTTCRSPKGHIVHLANVGQKVILDSSVTCLPFDNQGHSCYFEGVPSGVKGVFSAASKKAIQRKFRNVRW